ncbi:GCN5-related N-acetyltransferase [Pseudomonas ficuserectae]|nr:GCN5-related N-acetyltransferase [Pseudomonas ficuserectae]
MRGSRCCCRPSEHLDGVGLSLTQGADRVEQQAQFGSHRQKLRLTFRADRDQQTAAGLWVAQQVALGLAQRSDPVAIAFKIAQRAARHTALGNVMLDAGQARYSGVIQTSGQACTISHFNQMPEQTEAGDIGHCQHPGQLAEATARLVQGAHPVARQTDVFITQLRLFLGSSENANAQRLGQVQRAPRLGGVVAFHVLFLHHASYSQTEDRLRRIDGVPASQRDTGSVADGTTTANDFARHFWREDIDRPAEDGDGHQRIAAHRIDITNGIGRGDTAEVERVIDDRHKEVSGRDHAALVIQRIDRCVITRSIANPELGVEVLSAAASEDHVQHPGGNLADTPCSMTVLGQADWLIHCDTLGYWETG